MDIEDLYYRGLNNKLIYQLFYRPGKSHKIY